MNSDVIKNLFFMCLFLIYLYLPTVYVSAVFLQTRNDENTKLLVREGMSFALIRNLPAKKDLFQNWMDASLRFRNWMVKNFNYAYWRHLDLSIYPQQVIAGKNGWLFAGGKIFEEYAGKLKFSSAELDQWMSVMEARQKWLEGNGIRFYIILVPTKYHVYPEHLPFWVIKAEQTAIDQLRSRLDSSSLHYYDGLEVLLENKAKHLVYTMNDIHWTDSGAWFVFEGVKNDLKGLFPGSTSWPAISISGYDTIQESEWFCGLSRNILKIDNMVPCLWEAPHLEGVSNYAFSGKDAGKFEGKNNYDLRIWPNNTAVTVHNNNSINNGIKAFVIGNSFTGAISRYFNRLFYETSYDFIYRTNGENFKKKVDEVRPDIVIYITHYGTIKDQVYLW